MQLCIRIHISTFSMQDQWYRGCLEEGNILSYGKITLCTFNNYVQRRRNSLASIFQTNTVEIT